MFRLTAVADHLQPFFLEKALVQCAWTDVVHITVDGVEVYRDDVGIGTDLVPALDVVRETLLEPNTPFEVVLGRREGDVELLTCIESTPFRVAWAESARDPSLDRRQRERPVEHVARLRQLLRDGDLDALAHRHAAAFQHHLAAATAAGISFRMETVVGPRLFLRGDGSEDELAELHERFAGEPVPLGTDHALLRALLDEPAAPGFDVRIDHYGELLSLTDFRDVLAALATPPPELLA